MRIQDYIHIIDIARAYFLALEKVDEGIWNIQRVMSSNMVKAMVLAAGEGTRLASLTVRTPKVLLPIGGVPLIQQTLAWLKNYSISEIAINLYHLGNKIKDFLGNGSRFGMKVFYSTEETLLGTAGGVKRMEHLFSDTFVVVYGDTLTDFDLGAMIRFHKAKNSLATIAILGVLNPWDVGIVEMNEEGRILNFAEKPPRGSETSNLGSGGVYVLEKAIFKYIPAEGSSDFAYDIFPKLVELALPAYGYVLKPEDYLIDIGTLDKYQKANDDMEAGKVRIRYEEQSGIP